MTFDALLEFGGWLAVLWFAAESSLAGFVKPVILKPLRPRLEKIHPMAYVVVLKVFLFAAGAAVIYSFNVAEQYDVMGRFLDETPIWFNSLGVGYTPWVGCLISLLAMVLGGEWLHDYFKSHDLQLPILVKKA